MLTPGRARWIALCLLVLQVAVSTEMYNTAFSGLSDAEAVRQTGDLRPQIASIVLWLMLATLSHLPGALRYPLHAGQVKLPALLLAWAVLSFTWSDEPAATMPKAAALLLTNYAAWRLTALISARDMFACVYHTLGPLLIASAALALFVPSIGLVQQEWQHVGDWHGMFVSKQGLGMVSAVFTGIVLLRMIERRSWFDCAMGMVGAACLVGSGSRGAGVMAAVAVACLLAARVHPRLIVLVTGVLWAELLLAVANIVYLVTTGNESIRLFGHDINFTERSFIWQYALSLWSGRPYLGFGLNGFWTNPDIYNGYFRLHGWVLDNYHSGYMAVLLETGLIGFMLFLVLCCNLSTKLHRLLKATDKERRLSLEMAVVFLIMFFTINLTETYLSRSTNFLALLFTFLVSKVFQAQVPQPVRVAAGRRRLALG